MHTHARTQACTHTQEAEACLLSEWYLRSTYVSERCDLIRAAVKVNAEREEIDQEAEVKVWDVLRNYKVTRKSSQL